MTTLWLTTDGVIVPYNPPLHKKNVYKFLFWEDENGILVASPYTENTRTHLDLREYFSEYIPDRRPDGAGECALGEVQAWSSLGFEIQTREELKRKILKMLGMKQ